MVTYFFACTGRHYHTFFHVPFWLPCFVRHFVTFLICLFTPSGYRSFSSRVGPSGCL